MSNSDPERDQARLDLIRSLEPALGPDATDTLMRHLPPVTWDDLVTRADLALTEERLRNETSQLGRDLRNEMSGLGKDLTIERSRHRCRVRG